MDQNSFDHWRRFFNPLMIRLVGSYFGVRWGVTEKKPSKCVYTKQLWPSSRLQFAHQFSANTVAVRTRIQAGWWGSRVLAVEAKSPTSPDSPKTTNMKLFRRIHTLVSKEPLSIWPHSSSQCESGAGVALRNLSLLRLPPKCNKVFGWKRTPCLRDKSVTRHFEGFSFPKALSTDPRRERR